MKYWKDDQTYPGAELLGGLRPGRWYCYVPSSFLRGIALWVKPVAAILLERYRVMKPEAERAYENLRDLDDDVLVLGRVEWDPEPHNREPTKRSYWILLWWDCDCSDCCVGMWETEDDEAAVKAELARWIETETHRDLQGVEREDEHGGGWETTSDWAWLDVEPLKHGRMGW